MACRRARKRRGRRGSQNQILTKWPVRQDRSWCKQARSSPPRGTRVSRKSAQSVNPGATVGRATKMWLTSLRAQASGRIRESWCLGVQTSGKKDVFYVFCLAMECAFIIITSCKPPYFLPFLQKKSNRLDIRWSVLKPAWSFDQLLSMKSSEPRRRRVWMVGMDSLPFAVTWAGPCLSSATAARVIWLEGECRSCCLILKRKLSPQSPTHGDGLSPNGAECESLGHRLGNFAK